MFEIYTKTFKISNGGFRHTSLRISTDTLKILTEIFEDCIPKTFGDFDQKIIEDSHTKSISTEIFGTFIDIVEIFSSPAELGVKSADLLFSRIAPPRYCNQ